MAYPSVVIPERRPDATRPPGRLAPHKSDRHGFRYAMKGAVEISFPPQSIRHVEVSHEDDEDDAGQQCVGRRGAGVDVGVGACADDAGPRDPYTQGGATATPVDPSTSGARAGDKFDPYSQGAVQSTRQDLAPQQQQQMQMSSQQYDLVPGAATTTNRTYGSAAYQGDMRWTTPNLGRPLGQRNRYLDGA